MAHTATITRLGSEGHGIAQDTNGRTLYIPFTLPHESVTFAEINSSKQSTYCQALTIENTSEHRIAPRCKIFGTCGGCQLQHASPDTYNAFKTHKLHAVLHRLNVTPQHILPTTFTGYGSRRRIDLAVSSRKGEIILGFHGAFSPHVIDCEGACPITEPTIENLLPSLKNLCQRMKQPKHITGIQIQSIANQTLDIVLTLHKTLTPDDNHSWLDYGANTPAITRISTTTAADPTHTTTLYGNDAMVLMDNIPVTLPAGAFLQASEAGQRAIVQFIQAHTSNASNILDLFCGLGTYTLPLAQQGKTIRAYEGEERMVHALLNAAAHHSLGSRVTAYTRDLFKTPIPAQEIATHHAVIINPPRSGAQSQTLEIAKSNIPLVIMVSCNPVTFERDARTLLNAGYIMETIQAVDQFSMTSHLEILATFTR